MATPFSEPSEASLVNSPAKTPLYRHGIKDYIHQTRDVADFNYEVHDESHRPLTLVYTSASTLVTTVGSRIYLQRPGKILNARANVQTAPTSTLTWDVLKNGVSVFATKPTILTGNVFQNVTFWIDNGLVVADDFLQIQVPTIGGAVGPLVVLIEWLPIGAF